ncbi:MAG: oxygen-independent coproporphyrinogen III oxidase, partial [Candidatus Lindowbacteria bacterium]|nr:oxygen-independent coproporphyrinogen III oxidase [Candidatus Lindowbacteria bacterium]
VQDNNPEVQKAINRIQPREMTEQVVSWCRELNFDSVNIDLIYGLPLQTVESFSKTLGEILEMSPERLAIFNYAHVPWLKPHQDVLAKSGVLGADEKIDIFCRTVEEVTGAGYVYIGLDHFAKPEDELCKAQHAQTLQRNFQGYSTQGGSSIYGHGMSAVSQTHDAYFQNEKNLGDYYESIASGNNAFVRGYILSEDDKIRRYTIMNLMCNLKLNFDEVSKSLNIDFREYFSDEIQSFTSFQEDGLIEVTDNEISITDMGRMFIRNAAMKFDAYLDKSTSRFSKTL